MITAALKLLANWHTCLGPALITQKWTSTERFWPGSMPKAGNNSLLHVIQILKLVGFLSGKETKWIPRKWVLWVQPECGICEGGPGSLGIYAGMQGWGTSREGEITVSPAVMQGSLCIIVFSWADWPAKKACLSGDWIFISGSYHFISTLPFSSFPHSIQPPSWSYEVKPIYSQFYFPADSISFPSV